MPVNPEDRTFTDEDVRLLFDIALAERITPAFMFDEGVDHTAIALLKAHKDLFVTTVQEQGLTGEASDFRVLAYATQRLWVLVVADKSYSRFIHPRLDRLHLRHGGIISLRPSASPQKLAAFMRWAVERSVEKDINILSNQLWVLR